jgi:DNA-binding GntR family transcriptional regulator
VKLITKPVLATKTIASDDERERLGLLAGEMVFRVNRLRRLGEQLLFEEVALPAALFPDLLDNGPIGDIASLAARYGLELGDAVERVSIDASPNAAAVALNIGMGAKVQKHVRVVHLRDGRPAEVRFVYSLDTSALARLRRLFGC